tara:strand:- start:3300 stop:3659 length:360 start_codon:yes stop_codon:yes gene_type:complete
MRNRQDELLLQIGVVKWLKLQFPEIRYCASAGGMRTSLSVAKKMKASGYVKGFPDLFLYHPTNKHNGMAIELKANKKCYPSKEQKQWVSDLNDRGYYAIVSKGFDETIQQITDYLNERV